MQERYTGNGVIERGYAIYDEWNKNKYKSGRIVNSVQTAVASANAKNTPSTRVEALSHLFALDVRVKERYDNIFKCILLYFAWRREKGALKRFKGMLRLPDVNDIRAMIEVEVKRLDEMIDVDDADGKKGTTGGGRVNEFSPDESTAVANAEENQVSDKESTETQIDAEKREEEAVAGDREQIKEQSAESQKDSAENPGSAEKAQDAKERVKLGAYIDAFNGFKNENKSDNKAENNGFDGQSESITDKNIESNENKSYNYAIDIPPIPKEIDQGGDSDKIDFIDEVIMDNIIKGKSDIIGHNPLEDVAQNVKSDILSGNEGAQAEKNGNGDKDAYLYDKMLSDIKGEATTLSNTPKPELKIPQNNQTVQNDPKDKEPITVNEKVDDKLKAQAKVEENISEENMSRRYANDKYSDMMVILHKSLMEDALREDLRIVDMGLDEPLRLIEGSNFKEYQAETASVRKY